MTSPSTASASFRLSLSPASTTLTRYQGHGYSGHVTVTDTGSAAVNVHMSAIALGSSGRSCSTAHGAPAWLHVSAGSFKLAPGQARTVRYTVSAPAGTHGSGAVVATGSPVKPGHGNAKLSGSIGSRITLGSDHCTTIHPVAVAPTAHNGTPVGALVALALVLAALTLLAIGVRRHVMRRRAE